MSTEQKDAPTPQAASGTPDGTVSQAGIPIEIFSQRLAVPTPQAGEEIRAALEQYEGDGIVRDPKTKAWIYVRTRVFVDLKAQEKKDAAENPVVQSGDPAPTGAGDSTPVPGGEPDGE